MVKKCDGERQREGAALQKSISNDIDILLKVGRQMERMSAEAKKSLAKNYKKKLEKNSESLKKMDPQRLAQEVIILLDKSDISEEVVRFKEHLTFCRGF